MSNEAWKKKNTVVIAVRLQRSTDADLLAWLNNCATNSRAGEIKRLMRIAIAAEQNKQ